MAKVACSQDEQAVAAEEEIEINENEVEETEEDANDLDGELVVCSARAEQFVQELLNKFSEETGTEVQALHKAKPGKRRTIPAFQVGFFEFCYFHKCAKTIWLDFVFLKKTKKLR
ncbi:hypothetical protein [Bacillus sp. FJAT-44742]|uniref:hypothetical protein n=1 Tax=Bacillus sp. FJAT-44742 TaxID=2014005 RepID=UPI0018E24098|nr:hypothetical protein [Bacillus sp. FJAT-44742]